MFQMFCLFGGILLAPTRWCGWQIIQVLLEKCRTQEQSLEEADSVTGRCREVEAELTQLHQDLDMARLLKSKFDHTRIIFYRT